MYNDRLTGGRCSEVAYAVYNERLTDGCCSEVDYAMKIEKTGTKCGGRCRQVVVIRRWSLAQV